MQYTLDNMTNEQDSYLEMSHQHHRLLQEVRILRYTTLSNGCSAAECYRCLLCPDKVSVGELNSANLGGIHYTIPQTTTREAYFEVHSVIQCVFIC